MPVNIDSANKTISAQTDHNSQYALFQAPPATGLNFTTLAQLGILAVAAGGALMSKGSASDDED